MLIMMKRRSSNKLLIVIVTNSATDTKPTITKLSNVRSLQDTALDAAAKEMDEGIGTKSLAALSGLWLSGSKENTVYSGVDAQALPTLRLQA